MPGFVCCECGTKKESEQALKSHISIKHLLWLPFECPHCSAQSRCTREATKQDLLLHINETHPGQQFKYTRIPDSEKQQLLKHKMQLSTNVRVTHENSSTSSLPFSVTPPVLAVAAKRVKTHVITIDDDQDSKPLTLTAFNSSDQLSVNSEIANSAEKRNVKAEPVCDDDDDDFEPFAPSNNTEDSQSQQPNAHHSSAAICVLDSKTGDSSQKIVSGATKRAKLQSRAKAGRKKDSAYCLTCNWQYNNIYRHLETKLSAPVFECSSCTGWYAPCYRANSSRTVSNHIKAGRGCQGANLIRLRPKEDVAKEMQQLKQTHLDVVPRDWPYRCTECNTDVIQVPWHILKHHLKLERYECSVCGKSWPDERDRSAIKSHMKQKHPSAKARLTHNQTKYKAQIRTIEKAVIVRNK